MARALAFPFLAARHHAAALEDLERALRLDSRLEPVLRER
jgi:hypothetical protein